MNNGNLAFKKSNQFRNNKEINNNLDLVKLNKMPVTWSCEFLEMCLYITLSLTLIPQMQTAFNSVAC